MSVLKLTTHNFRNLKSTTLDFHPDLNFVIGDNGSGKSSLLEAVFYLGHGKSYRTSNLVNLVNFQESQFTVSIRDGNDRQLGVSRNVSNNETQIRIDGKRYSRLSDLVKNVAVQIVTPESFKLFIGGARERRRFVDLGLFHVKHHFSVQWREFSKVLKQRNACLKSNDSHSMLSYWTELFCRHSLEVAESRENYVSELVAELKIWTLLLLPKIEQDITVQYSQGWNQKKDLLEILNANKERELSYGHSLFGAHKFDIKFLINRRVIDVKLSRGEQKLFLLALTFAQANLIKKVKRVKPILLIDDVGAELDDNSRTLLSNAISELDCQVIITAIEKNVLEPFLCQSKVPENEISKHENFKMFHVEHGQISVMSE
ncbi:MAG: DNA replication/repair protein RecF [Alteromonadaceae bacterium]|nr:DNA replication/repair protein RecF [Alteromonadaceae bacterium]